MRVALFLACLPTIGLAEQTLPQVFKLDCKWKHETQLDESDHAPETPSGIALSSSKRPVEFQTEHHAMTAELRGVGGTRHFLQPDIGGALAGMFVTVYADGQSLRVQNYRIHGSIRMHASLGKCKVIE